MEGCLKSLPSPIRNVIIPETFTVSQVVSAVDCLLRALMANKSDVERLPPHPRAEMGNVIHAMIEDAIKGVLSGVVTSAQALEATIDHLLEQTRVRLERNQETATYANLKQTMTPLEWERKRRKLVDSAYSLAKNVKCVQKSIGRSRRQGFSFEDARGSGSWTEVPIHVPALRLRGRIDVLERNTKVIKISDLKSGNILDLIGAIKPDISLQLHIYGIMAQSLDPGAHVSLVINNGTEHHVPFEQGDVDATIEWLSSFMRSMVPGRTVLAEEIARVGPVCRWCDIRHRCSRYLCEAPKLWGHGVEWRLPMDTWGKMEAIDHYKEGLVTVTLRDSAGRRVKLSNIREIHLTEFAVGKKLWFFELLSSPASRGTPWRHPLNFFEMSDSSMVERAWCLRVYVE